MQSRLHVAHRIVPVVGVRTHNQLVLVLLPRCPARASLAAWWKVGRWKRLLVRELIPVGLLLLSAIPLASGAFRLMGLGGGPELMPANARFSASPLPVVLHIVSVSIFAILGAFQFSTGFRRRRPGWHRAAGRLVVACGLLVGLSGLWLTLFYSHPDGSKR